MKENRVLGYLVANDPFFYMYVNSRKENSRHLRNISSHFPKEIIPN